MIQQDETVERIRASLDLAPVDGEEAETQFLSPSGYLTCVGFDVVPELGPVLLKCCKRTGRIVLSLTGAAGGHNTGFHDSPRLREDYGHALERLKRKVSRDTTEAAA